MASNAMQHVAGSANVAICQLELQLEEMRGLLAAKDEHLQSAHEIIAKQAREMVGAGREVQLTIKKLDGKIHVMKAQLQHVESGLPEYGIGRIKAVEIPSFSEHLAKPD